MLEKEEQEIKNTVIEFGNGVVFSTPISGNKVTFWQYWTLRRIRVALFGHLVRAVSVDFTGKIVKEVIKNGYLYTANVDELMIELAKQKGKLVWVKPNWMRRIAAMFKPKTDGGATRG